VDCIMSKKVVLRNMTSAYRYSYNHLRPFEFKIKSDKTKTYNKAIKIFKRI